MPPRIDISGVTVGRLTVKRLSRRAKPGNYYWLCDCSCGRTGVEIPGSKLGAKKRPTLSCGCLRDEATAARSRKHGHTIGRTFSPEYQSWRGMIERCTNPKNTHFKHYGLRGISVCERWRTFENFIADMGVRPSGKTLDRVDVNGNYDPGNCRWADAVTQARNHSSSRFVIFRGERTNFTTALEQLGISRNSYYDRLKRGWSEYDALHRPPIPRGPKYKGQRGNGT